VGYLSKELSQWFDPLPLLQFAPENPDLAAVVGHIFRRPNSRRGCRCGHLSAPHGESANTVIEAPVSLNQVASFEFGEPCQRLIVIDGAAQPELQEPSLKYLRSFGPACRSKLLKERSKATRSAALQCAI
jgi:hypothetical protein